MAARRGHGEGAVFKRSDGQWVARVERGRDANGNRVRQTLYAHTKPELLAKLRQAQTEAAHGLPAVDQRQTVGMYLEWWSEKVLPGTIRPNSAANYKTAIKCHIVPSIGSVRLAKLAPEHVEEMIRDLAARGLKPATQAYARAVLRRALGTAERHGHVLRNAAALAEGPKGAGARLDDAPTPNEGQRILDTARARSDRLYALAAVALSLGLRRGELLALRWDHVDLDSATLTVSGSLARIKGAGLIVNEPKTAASVRVLPLVEPSLTAMRDHRKAQAVERLAAAHWHDPDIVFASPVGTYLDPRNVTRWWHDLTKSAGIGRRRLHASRHAAVISPASVV
jgi:integrase